MTSKSCSRCSREAPIDDFYVLRSGVPHSWCKECCRANTLLRQDIPSRDLVATEKTCSRCRETKSIDEFYVKHRPSGQRTSRCRSCVCEGRTAWRRANPETWRANDARYRERHPEAVRAYRRARKARERGAPISETIMRITVFAEDDYRCYLCGDVFNVDGLELDHIVPLSRGGTHTRSNVATACIRCNRRKGHKLLEEMTVRA